MLAYFRSAEKPPDDGAARRETERALAILDTLPPLCSESRPYVTAAVWFRNHGDIGRALALLQRGQSVDEAQTAELIRLNRAHGKRVFGAGSDVLYLELGRTYLAAGDAPRAVEALAHARAIRPAPEYFAELAGAYRGMGQWQGAATALMEGLLADPGQGALAAALVDVYRAYDPGDCAIRGNAIDLNCATVRGHFCEAARSVVQLHVAGGHMAEAARVQQSAVQEFGCAVQ
jgi:tetratricopeptide (TPR) repeat protein